MMIIFIGNNFWYDEYLPKYKEIIYDSVDCTVISFAAIDLYMLLQ
jgi:hypothetical protein